MRQSLLGLIPTRLFVIFIADGLKVAIEVPFKLANTVNGIWGALEEMASVGNINCKSDLQVY